MYNIWFVRHGELGAVSTCSICLCTPPGRILQCGPANKKHLILSKGLGPYHMVPPTSSNLDHGLLYILPHLGQMPGNRFLLDDLDISR